jgi:hypothetical protein
VLIGISVNFGPPAIPVYYQPPCPTRNYIWSPGYWAFADGDYYWVPGTWVRAPRYGLLWTPGYWAWNDGRYYWNQGFWATQVGFYGGVNYGYGYYGNGYVGGRWQGDQFRYNTAVTDVNRNVIQNVYSDRVAAANNSNRVSYNGGRGGITARPTQSQRAVQSGNRVSATSVQVQQQRVAVQNHANFSSVNHGRPATAAVARPLTSARQTTTQRAAAPRAVTQRAAAPRAVTQHAAAPRAVTPRAPARISHVQAQPRQGKGAPGGAQPRQGKAGPAGGHPAGPQGGGADHNKPGK